MTKEQYKESVRILSSMQIDFLKTLYYCKDHSATATTISQIRGYKDHRGANSVIGNIGKKFAAIEGVETDTYFRDGEEKPAYFELVGPWVDGIGWKMHRELYEALEDLGVVSSDENAAIDVLPTESLDFENVDLKEGKVVTVKVNRYERNTIARQKCIDHYGHACQICGVDFGEVYGKDAEGYIHVHHIKPIAEVEKEYVVDPVNDLIPVCPNCHSALHLSNPPKGIREMQKLFKK